MCPGFVRNVTVLIGVFALCSLFSGWRFSFYLLSCQAQETIVSCKFLDLGFFLSPRLCLREKSKYTGKG